MVCVRAVAKSVWVKLQKDMRRIRENVCYSIVSWKLKVPIIVLCRNGHHETTCFPKGPEIANKGE